MGDWRKDLKTRGTLEGIPFEVVGHEAEFSRSVVTHEFPDQDKSKNEDTGKLADKFKVDAFVIGSDYMTARNSLIAVVRKGGALKLVHPWLGALTVRCPTVTVSEHRDGKGQALFQFTFVEEAPATFLIVKQPPSALVISAAAAARAATQSAFAKKFNAISQLIRVTTRAVSDVSDRIEAATDAIMGPHAALINDIGKFNSAVATLQSNLDTLINTPGDLLDRYATLLDVFVGVVEDFGKTIGRLASLRALLSDGRDGPVASEQDLTLDPGEFSTVADTQIATNALAFDVAAYQTAVIAYAVEAGGRPFPFVTVEDAEQVSRELVEAIDAIMESAEDPEIYDSFCDLRGAVVTAIHDATASLPRRRTFTPDVPMTTLHVAYDLFEDTNKAEEIGDLNGVFHPLLLATEPLTVVTPQ